MTTVNIQAALQKLDPNNDNHWTGDGQPRLDTVKMLVGNQKLTREEINTAAPTFSRAAALQGLQPGAPSAPAPTPDPAAVPAATAPQPPTGDDPVQDGSADKESTGSGADAAPVAPVTQAKEGLPPPAMTQLNPLAAPQPPVDMDALERKKHRLAVLRHELGLIAKAEIDIKKEKQVRQTEADDLLIQIDKAEPRNSNQEAISQYLARQKQNLAMRSQQKAIVKNVEKDLGLKLADLLPKRSPLDASMMRKTGRGRPSF